MDLANTLARESTALKADFIHSVRAVVTGGADQRERQHVLCDGRAPADVGVRADTHELVHRAKRPDHSPFFHRDMARERSPVDQHGVIADDTIVPNVRVRHDERMAADASGSSAFFGSAIERDALANDIVVANRDCSLLAAVGDVLRLAANGAKREESIVGADGRWTVNGDVRDQFAVLVKVNVSTDYAIWAYVAGGMHAGTGGDDGSGMNHP